MIPLCTMVPLVWAMEVRAENKIRDERMADLGIGGKVIFNGLALGEEADFEALNCLPALNLIRRTKLHLSTEPAFLPNAC